MKLIVFCLWLFTSSSLLSQIVIPHVENKSELDIHNREVNIIMHEEGNVHGLIFDAKQGDGLAIFKNIELENGTIEFDVKGKNIPGKSFVGLAFHIQHPDTFNAIYFRPFNFKNPDKTRSGHSVQYICHPDFPWQKLRQDFPEEFENPVSPVPNPEDFFHAKVIVKWPWVSVYVENATEPSLKVKMKSKHRNGKVGFWVGNGSDGEFKNLVVKNL